MSTEAEDSLHISNQLCFPLYAATNLIQQLYRPFLKPLKLTYSQYLVMLVLWEKDTVYVTDICTCLHLDIGTVSPLLKRMEKAGLLTRRRDPNDERKVVISLTDQGKSLQEQARHIPHTLRSSVGLNPEEISKLKIGVDQLLVKLSNTGK